MTADAAGGQRVRGLRSIGRRFAQAWVSGALKFVVSLVLCLNPIGAIYVLGWLTEKTRLDVLAVRAGDARQWPPMLRVGAKPVGLNPLGIVVPLWRGIVFYGWNGLKAWLGVALLVAPFGLVWLAGWFAGWENSFNKGYELSAVWPVVSLAAVLLSLPVLVMVPMAIAHQAVSGRVKSVFEWRMLVRLIRAVGWRYVGLTLLIVIGAVGVFGVRALPVFAEHISSRVASGVPEAIAAFAAEFQLLMTALLLTGLLVMRRVMVNVYVYAEANEKADKLAGWLKTGAVFVILAVLWFDQIAMIYVAQFMNFSWWSWVNQPVIMLPWLGVLS